MSFGRHCRRLALTTVAVLASASSGCMGLGHHDAAPEAPAAALGPPAHVPNELNMIALPPYVVGNPDVLSIDVRTIPKPGDTVPVALPLQSIQGPHLVRPDGYVNLGIWGSVSVVGLTTDQIQEAVRRHVFEKLGQFEKAGTGTVTQPDNPNKIFVAVDVVTYNSQGYFVITDNAGFGEQIYRFPIQGNETVLHALANINGLPAVASKTHIWVARRSPRGQQPEQILPVDYIAMTQHGDSRSNYQILPGDRVYVRADRYLRVDGYLQKVLTPIERIIGFGLLGSSTYNSITGRQVNQGN